MQKILQIAGGIVAVAVVIAGIVMFTKSGSQGDGGNNGLPSTVSYKVVKACDALSLKDANVILGEDAKAGATNGKSDSSSADIAISTCSYSGKAQADAQQTQTITLLARSARSKAGADSNEGVFGHDKPVGKKDVTGVGDAAFWDAELSQLDVLKGHNWYIIGNMSGANADSGSLEVSRAVYEQIKAKL